MGDLVDYFNGYEVVVKQVRWCFGPRDNPHTTVTMIVGIGKYNTVPGPNDA